LQIPPLTSQEPHASYPLTLELGAAKLPKRSWVKTSQIRTLSTERIGKRLGRDVRVAVSIDPALLGGAVIRAGDTVIDGSLRGRLNKLADALLS